MRILSLIILVCPTLLTKTNQIAEIFNRQYLKYCIYYLDFYYLFLSKKVLENWDRLWNSKSKLSDWRFESPVFCLVCPSLSTNQIACFFRRQYMEKQCIYFYFLYWTRHLGKLQNDKMFFFFFILIWSNISANEVTCVIISAIELTWFFKKLPLCILHPKITNFYRFGQELSMNQSFFFKLDFFEKLCALLILRFQMEVVCPTLSVNHIFK